MMRLSTAEIYRTGIDQMLTRQQDLLKTQLKLSTGKNILSPSDDPGGSVQALDLRSAIAATDQYMRNITHAERRLELEQTVLARVTDNLQRAHELAVQAANGTQSAQTRANTASEVRQIFAEILQLANTIDANGEYIFGGVDSLSEAFTVDSTLTTLNVTYNGHTDVRQLQISAERRMPIGHSGQEAFIDSNIFSTLESYIDALESNDVPGIQQSIDDLLAANDEILNLRAVVGGRLKTLDSTRIGQETTQIQHQSTISSIEDLDYAKAISDFQMQMAGLQASQQSYMMVQRLSLFNFL